MNDKLLLALVTVMALGMIPGALAVGGLTQANDIYQHDHKVGVTNVCGLELCSQVFGKGGPQFHYRSGATAQSVGNNTGNVEMWVMFPDGFKLDPFILSKGNYTAFENNVGTMAVEDIHTVNIAPSTNYCPIALTSLVHQDGYLPRIFNETNGTVTKDLTHQVYPDYCLPETGQNPYSPIVPVPEFGTIACIVMVIAIIASIAIGNKNKLGF